MSAEIVEIEFGDRQLEAHRPALEPSLRERGAREQRNGGSVDEHFWFFEIDGTVRKLWCVPFEDGSIRGEPRVVAFIAARLREILARWAGDAV